MKVSLRTLVGILAIAQILIVPVPAQERKEPDDTEQEEAFEQRGKEAVIDAVKNSDDKENLEDALEKAKSKKQATDQQLLEGKILWALVRMEDFDYLQTFAAEIAAGAKEWKAEEGIFFKKRKQIEAVQHFLLALQADIKGDAAVAEREILQAIWLDPSREEYVKAITIIQPPDQKIAMDLKLETVDGNKTTLADYAKGNKALYIQIWATWCGPCLKLFPTLTARAKMLPPQGVNVVSLNSELGRQKGGGGNRLKAKELMLAKQMNLPWLIEPAGSPYTDSLEVDSVPRALVVDPQGNVLFNAHPSNKRLTAVLNKLGVTKFDIKAGGN